jgi:pimeloyl-ACP methyl ester carboxylesterase
VTRILYLHGFASSPKSSKATFLGTRLAACGATVETPDLNEPDFSTLTVTRMLGQVRNILDRQPEGPITVIGSSLGGFVAVQAALQHPSRVARLVLLAPALDFGGQRMPDGLGDRSLEDWKATGELNVFHHAYGRMYAVHYGLYADARQYDAHTATLEIPVQVFQGRRDTSVDPGTVERWASSRPNVELHLLDDDHQLTASLDYIWTHVRRFLGLGRTG